MRHQPDKSQGRLRGRKRSTLSFCNTTSKSLAQTDKPTDSPDSRGLGTPNTARVVRITVQPRSPSVSAGICISSSCFSTSRRSTAWASKKDGRTSLWSSSSLYIAPDCPAHPSRLLYFPLRCQADELIIRRIESFLANLSPYNLLLSKGTGSPCVCRLTVSALGDFPYRNPRPLRRPSPRLGCAVDATE